MFLIRELTVNDYDALVALWKEAGLPYRPNGRDQRERIAREVAGRARSSSSLRSRGTSSERSLGHTTGARDG
ncbi:hypothetical protein KAX17_06600 [Candidatus Bipolaricaulota bacterium]|nr:hypothetical protein [Candidatus Bipolaricaulota bacterium]